MTKLKTGSLMKKAEMRRFSSKMHSYWNTTRDNQDELYPRAEVYNVFPVVHRL